jgi:hypothetical protein
MNTLYYVAGILAVSMIVGGLLYLVINYPA